MSKFKMKYKRNAQFLFYILALFSMVSCGDIFEREKKITGHYYLGQSERAGEELILYYRNSDGNLIGRVPANVLKYGFTDSFIVAQSKTYNNEIKFYIINRQKDSYYAHEKDFLVGSLTKKEYNEQWQPRLKIKFIKVK